MRDPNRIPVVLAAVERRWREAPDLRLGQLLVNLVRVASGRHDASHALFALDDDRLVGLLEADDDDPRAALRRAIDELELAVNDVHRDVTELDADPGETIGLLYAEVERVRRAAAAFPAQADR